MRTASAIAEWLDRIYHNRIYQRLSGPLVIVALVFAMLGVGAAYLNGRADTERTAALLRCTDDRDAYSAASSITLREVTQTRDNLAQKRGWATLRKEASLETWTNILLVALARTDVGDGALVEKFLNATTELNASAANLRDIERDLIQANRDLKVARQNNPIVPAASEVCASGSFVPPANP